jgi:hypothetical protein
MRKLFTRALATGALLTLYACGTLATTGVLLASGMSTAYAQRGRGRGRGRGSGVGAAAVGVGVGALIVGGAIAAQRQSEYNAAVRECQRMYGRRYILETKEFIGPDGGYYPCP